jgi:hypothetical protein
VNQKRIEGEVRGVKMKYMHREDMEKENVGGEGDGERGRRAGGEKERDTYLHLGQLIQQYRPLDFPQMY